jgi:hypothetical protein
MHRWSPVVAITTLALFLATSLLTGSTKGSMRTAAEPPQLMQVRAEYIDLDGNRDETFTTLILVNNSQSRTINLGDLFALGPDGLTEVMGTHTGLNGVALPPLATIELLVDSVRFPGLQPELQIGDRGVANVLVQWWGTKDSLLLSSSIYLQKPGNPDTRVITVFEGHIVGK